MLIKKEASCLLLIDVQEKLTPLIQNSESILLRCHWMMQLANELGVPIFISEQYPKGLKHTVAPLAEFKNDYNVIEKTTFSSFQCQSFVEKWQESGRSQAIIIGIETHVCVLQTALELKEAGYDVFVVVDATSSRHESDSSCGLDRLKHNGVQLVTSEMVFFEWLRAAGTEQFKQLSQKYLR